MYIIITLECFLPMALPIVKYEVNIVMTLNIHRSQERCKMLLHLFLKSEKDLTPTYRSRLPLIVGI
jgi:hypothetical protein